MKPSQERMISDQESPFHRQRPIRLSPFHIVFLALVAIVILAVIGFWTYHAVKESLDRIFSSSLQTILDADITALEIWIENEKEHAVSWADDPDLGEHVRDLVRIGRAVSSPGKALLGSPSFTALQEKLSSVIDEKDYPGFAVIDRTGLVLCSNKEEPQTGKYLSPAGMALLTGVFEDNVLLHKPLRKGTMLKNARVQAYDPVMIAAAPVRDGDDRIIATLVFLINPDLDFTRILSAGRMGKTGDTYAFDENGFLISDSRFEEQLKEIGLIPDLPEARSVLSVQIRDPGGDLTRGYRTETSLAARPLTRMAAAAVSGESGIDLEGYRDYRGVTVIGAWRWLPEYGFGVATEASTEKVFGVLHPLRSAFLGLFVLLIASTGAILFSTISIRHLRRRIDEVRQLGQYTLEDEIGEGGMGKVYKARHAMLKRPTAVKLLMPDRANEETIARFEREVQMTSQLTHPNTIEIYDYGRTPEGIFYYAMEYLPGVTLSRLIEMEGAIPPARVIHILRQVCYSLKEAHGIGLIHRDIKPMNIMLCERGGIFDAVKVLDFGLVKDISGQDMVHMTTTQEITGTPAYIAPERLADPLNIDVRSDIYSLGSVGFNLLTGSDVFQGPTAMEICYHVMKTPPPRPSERVDRRIPDSLDRLIYACVAKDPADRPQNVGEIINILDSIGEGGQWTQEEARRCWKEKAEEIPAMRKPSSPG